MTNQSGSAFTRRTFLSVAGGVSAAAILAACAPGGGGGGGGGGGDVIKFWNQPWGGTTFNPLDKEITEAYEPADGLPKATYQTVQWANFIQTYSSAIASKTGPAVSSGGGTQAFLFESQGAIAYADGLLESWQSSGLYDDFLPGLIDTLKVENGYAAVPYNLDMRVLWYSKTLMEQAGATEPTDWQSFLDACEALKQIGVYGYGTSAGAGSFTGGHHLVSWMIGNGGGLFDEDQQPNCVTPNNIEAMDFVLECVAKGYIDPAAASYTADNAQQQWKDGKYGMGLDTGGLARNLGGEFATDVVVGTPLESPNGTKGMLFFPNNIMMYTNTPSQEGSEAFLTYYYENMSRLWTEGTGIGLPPLKSIADTPEFKEDPNNVRIIEEWQPIAKTWAAPGSDSLFLGVTSVDGTPIMDTFTQSILTGAGTSEELLKNLEDGIKQALA